MHVALPITFSESGAAKVLLSLLSMRASHGLIIDMFRSGELCMARSSSVQPLLQEPRQTGVELFVLIVVFSHAEDL